MAMAKRIPLPAGWHRGRPKKTGVYATSRACLVKDGKVIGNGYATFGNGQWSRFKTWGSHSDCADFIWRAGGPDVR